MVGERSAAEVEFAEALPPVGSELRPTFERLLSWARALPGVAGWKTLRDGGCLRLEPLPGATDEGLVAIVNEGGMPALAVNIAAVAAVAPGAWQMLLRQEPGLRGRTGFAAVSDPGCVNVLDILLCAYDEAATAGR